MPEVVTTALMNAGILGPILIALGWYVIRRDKAQEKSFSDFRALILDLQKKIDSTHEKRVEDAQKVAAVLIEQNDRWQGIVASFLQTTSEQNVIIERIREMLDKLWDRLHVPR